MVEHSISPICAGVVQLTRDFDLATFGPQMVIKKNRHFFINKFQHAVSMFQNIFNIAHACVIVRDLQ